MPFLLHHLESVLPTIYRIHLEGFEPNTAVIALIKWNSHYVFGQKIGSKVGNTVTEGCCFPWCSLQNSFYLFSYPSCRRTSTSSNNGFAAPSNRKCNKSDPDEEEYYCLRPTGTASKPTVVATASTRGHHNKNDRLASSALTSDDRNPDVIPGSGGIHVNIHAPGIYVLRLRKKCIVRMMTDRKHMAFLRRVFIAEDILPFLCRYVHLHFCFFTEENESLRSGTPVKSDISGAGSVSGYGTGDSGSDKTPPYLPTSRPTFATLGHTHKMGISNPLEMSYSQLTLPHSSSRAGSPHAHQLTQQQQYGHSPPRFAVGDNKAIYSQIDVNRKVNGGHPHATSTKIATNSSYPSENDPLSWAPLLRNRNQPESAL